MLWMLWIGLLSVETAVFHQRAKWRKVSFPFLNPVNSYIYIFNHWFNLLDQFICNFVDFVLNQLILLLFFLFDKSPNIILDFVN